MYGEFPTVCAVAAGPVNDTPQASALAIESMGQGVTRVEPLRPARRCAARPPAKHKAPEGLRVQNGSSGMPCVMLWKPETLDCRVLIPPGTDLRV